MTIYREKKYYCGNYLEVDIYPLYHQIRGKRTRIKNTSDVQKAINNRNRVRKLTRLLNTNFTEDDIKIELTYSDKNVPHSDEEAQKKIRNFLRRLKRFRKNNDFPELKYIIITEKGKKTGRYHHHAVLSGGMLSKDITRIWGQGVVRITQLVMTEEGLSGLAEYLTKNISNGDIEENKKAWQASKNLIPPKERKNDSRISRKKAREMYENQECRDIFEKLYPEYDLVASRPFYNEVNGQYYLCLNMIRKNQKSTRVRKSERKRC